jgi:hypothetical protein
VEIDLFIFEAPPQPFHEDIVAPAAGPVHANLNATVFQEPSELLAGELTPLISPNRTFTFRYASSSPANLVKSGGCIQPRW